MERYKVGNSETIANHSSDWLSFFFFFYSFSISSPEVFIYRTELEIYRILLVPTCEFYKSVYNQKAEQFVKHFFFSSFEARIESPWSRYKNYQIKNSRQIWKISKWDTLTFTSWKIIENWNFVYSLSFTRFDRLVYLSLIISIIEKLQPK